MLMNLFVFFLLFGAFSLLMGLHRKDFVSFLKYVAKPSLKRRIRWANAEKSSFISNQLAEVRQILSIYNVPGGIWLLYFASVGLALMGFALSRFVNNIFLAPILIPTFACVPFAAIKLFWLYKGKKMNDTLESALNSITSSYLRSSGSIIAAVEENIAQLPNPVHQVFQYFLLQTTYVDASIADALEGMKLTVHNPIFHQWVDVLIQAESNHTMKQNLTNILDKFAEARDVEAEIRNILDDAKRSYFLMVGVSACLVVVVWLSNSDWQKILSETTLGKLLIAGYFAGVAVSALIAYSAHRKAVVQGD